MYLDQRTLRKQLDHWLRVLGSMARLSRQWACINLGIKKEPFKKNITKHFMIDRIYLNLKADNEVSSPRQEPLAITG